MLCRPCGSITEQTRAAALKYEEAALKFKEWLRDETRRLHHACEMVQRLALPAGVVGNSEPTRRALIELSPR